MNRKSASSLLFVVFLAAVSTSFGQATNTWETFEGTVSLKGLGKDPFNTVNPVYFSDVKVSAKIGANTAGPKVSGPAGVFPGTNSTIAVAGAQGTVVKVNNKLILESASIDPKGRKIRWARVGGVPYLQAYDKNGPVKLIPTNLVTADVSWAKNYAGTYGGGADLTATPTASGTQVIVANGKLSGLTEVYGKALGIPFSGVGKFMADNKKQLGTSSVRVAGIGEP